MAGILGQWLTPERAIAMQGLGMGLSQLGAGQPVNLSPAYAALEQRRQQAQLKSLMEQPGMMDRFNPQQKAALAAMPEGLATKILMESIFAPPAEPTKGIAVGGNVVNPITGEIIYQGPAEAPKPTDDMREFEFAKSQGYPGSFTEWQMETRRAGATTVNVGTTGIDYGQPPKDMAWARDQQGNVMLDSRGAPMAVMISGSPSDTARVGDIAKMAGDAISSAEKTSQRDTREQLAGSVVLEDIGRVKKKIEDAPWYSPTAGFVGNILKDVAGTQAADVSALTTTIRANIGFDRLQQMREASPTGGALGNVSDREVTTLQAVLGSLEQSQSEAQLLENLDRLEGIYTTIMKKAAAYPNAAEFGFDGAGSVRTDDLSAEERKYLGLD